jgi:hypothetical protein
MLSLPQKPFLAVGLLEAFGAAAGMAAGGNFLKTRFIFFFCGQVMTEATPVYPLVTINSMLLEIF